MKYTAKFFIVGGESFSHTREFASIEDAEAKAISEMTYDFVQIPISEGHVINLNVTKITHFEIMDEKAAERYDKQIYESAWGVNSYM